MHRPLRLPVSSPAALGDGEWAGWGQAPGPRGLSLRSSCCNVHMSPADVLKLQGLGFEFPATPRDTTATDPQTPVSVARVCQHHKAEEGGRPRTPGSLQKGSGE